MAASYSLSAAGTADVTDLSQRVEPEEAPAGRAAEKYKGPPGQHRCGADQAGGGKKFDTRELMPTIQADVATWEREIMLERQREGIAKAAGDRRCAHPWQTARDAYW